jgi:protein-tyrosine kinase
VRTALGGVVASNPDHLIERAAAQLRTAHGLVVPDQPGRAPASFVPSAPPGAPAAAIPAAIPDAMPGAAAIPNAPGPAVAGPDGPAILSASPSVPTDPASSPAPIPLADLKRVGLVVTDSGRSRISEEYRIIADRLRRASANADRVTRNLVMVTSARPNEGKSFTSLNLAASIARSRSGRVILVDADVGPRALTLQLGFKDRAGLHDLISDPALRPDPFVLETEFAGLYFLPLGHPARVRNGTLPFGPALERLSRRYVDTVIVLDTPPVLSTSDPHAIAPHVAQVVLVVEAERTQRGEVEAALELVRACPLVSAVLNKTRLSASHTFGAHDGYYYATPA